jgi:hypothetical protein
VAQNFYCLLLLPRKNLKEFERYPPTNLAQIFKKQSYQGILNLPTLQTSLSKRKTPVLVENIWRFALQDKI